MIDLFHSIYPNETENSIFMNLPKHFRSYLQKQQAMKISNFSAIPSPWMWPTTKLFCYTGAHWQQLFGRKAYYITMWRCPLRRFIVCTTQRRTISMRSFGLPFFYEYYFAHDMRICGNVAYRPFQKRKKVERKRNTDFNEKEPIDFNGRTMRLHSTAVHTYYVTLPHTHSLKTISKWVKEINLYRVPAIKFYGIGCCAPARKRDARGVERGRKHVCSDQKGCWVFVFSAIRLFSFFPASSHPVTCIYVYHFVV